MAGYGNEFMPINGIGVSLSCHHRSNNKQQPRDRYAHPLYHLCPQGLPLFVYRAIHFIRISSTDSFFFSANFVRGSREATYPPTAAAARKTNISRDNQGFPVARPAKSTKPQVEAKTI